MGVDKGRYYLKNARIEPRALVGEQIVARLGAVLGAPVPEVVLLHWSKDHIPAHMRDLYGPGLAHGSRKVGGAHVEELKQRVGYVDVADNRTRYLKLAVLFGLTDADDAQFIAELAVGQRVWSVDHGMFLRARLDGAWGEHDRPPVALYAPIADACAFTRDEHIVALSTLARLRPCDLVEAIGATPREWFSDATEPERIALYLAKRRDIFDAQLRRQIDGGPLS